jgi:protein tyrosine phosphatase (PTP) superfamily phosphohydrolase (DUF442 family)
LVLAGCQGLGNCGGGNPCREPNPLQRVGQRIFNRQPAGVMVDGCEPGLIGGGSLPLSAGAPVITNPGVVGEESAPVELLPAEPTSRATPNGGTSSGANPTGSRQGAGKAVYETYQPQGGPNPARLGRSGLSQVAGAGQVADPLANLPKLEVPADFNESSALALDANDISKPAPPDSTAGESVASMAPGFRSFKVVEPRLAAGSSPGARGWSWLADQGYKTVIDLRPTSELRAEDIPAINAAGLRYLALPTSDEAIESPSHLARFAAEIAQDSARPLYFFDSDGARASVIWYLHQVANQKNAPNEAARLAGEIGPHDDALWQKAAAVVAKLQPTQTDTSSDQPGNGSEKSVETNKTQTATPPVEGANPGISGPNAPIEANARHNSARPAMPQLSDASAGHQGPDPTAWKPFAALAAAGLAVPLGLVGRSTLARIANVRASLPAPVHAPRSIPLASGA